MSLIERIADLTSRGLFARFQPPEPALSARFSAAGQPALLRAWQSLSLARCGGVAVECVRGAVWVTQDGDPKDVLLVAGQRYAADRDVYMIVQAIEDAEIRLTYQ